MNGARCAFLPSQNACGTCTGVFVDNVGNQYPDQIGIKIGGLFIFGAESSTGDYFKMVGVDCSGNEEYRHISLSSYSASDMQANWAGATVGGEYQVSNLECNQSATSGTPAAPASSGRCENWCLEEYQNDDSTMCSVMDCSGCAVC